MRVVVVGAGVSGLALAHGLLGDGHEVVVLERSPEPRRDGAAVTLWANGTAALRLLGVDVDAVVASGRRLGALETWSSRGRRLSRLDVAALDARLGSPTAVVARCRLVELLLDALPAGTVVPGARVVGTAGDDRGAQALLADGTAVAGDVVVGADGSGSPVRRGLRPGDDPPPAGWTSWQGLGPVDVGVDLDADPGDPSTAGAARAVTLVGPEGFCGLLPAGGGLLQWWFDVRGELHAPGASPVAALRRRFGRWPDPVPRLLAAVADGDLSRWPHRAAPAWRTWGAGRVTLAGDAVHTMPPGLAQGVNQALQDVLALTRALGDPAAAADPAAALRGYERARARQVAPVARLAATEASITYRRSSAALMTAMPDRLTGAVYRGLLVRSSPALRPGAAVAAVRSASSLPR